MEVTPPVSRRGARGDLRGLARSEHTLSIHTIVTRRREGFYWTAILFTFALGTAAGDLVAESMDLGYWRPGLIFGAVIARSRPPTRVPRAGAIPAFWIAYVLTRPLGASSGDGCLPGPGDGGLGLGTVVTSALFLATILTLVVYLSITKRDTPPVVPTDERSPSLQR